MSKLAIVYFSASNKTHLMAEAIAEGASQVVDVKVELLRIVTDQIVKGVWQNPEIIAKLNQADAIVFGSPTYMGGVAGEFKLFIDAASEVWFKQGWKDKIAAGFTHSSCLSGDKQGTLLSLAINAAQHGMIWVNVGDLPSHFLGKDDGVNRLGSFLGVMGQGSVMSGVEGKLELDPGDYLTAFRFGQRIAEATQRWGKVE
ncbi:flavodoxin family protein [Limnofasciculus baicalensis]|uniref:Flavodoxin family protein n=1 Tax=Limnofasciculus baicalensis BBK-W-15 TaxID=2699891 RepID=A0AAE3KMF2_9CYAN|nr:flavodoxin family protein [Limnofasciculus baicalensis]MCP2727588.1 flavodoxin family protein [Limnofasciculus baicalensis BBK-W-15]